MEAYRISVIEFRCGARTPGSLRKRGEIIFLHNRFCTSPHIYWRLALIPIRPSSSLRNDFTGREEKQRQLCVSLEQTLCRVLRVTKEFFLMQIPGPCLWRFRSPMWSWGTSVVRSLPGSSPGGPQTTLWWLPQAPGAHTGRVRKRTVDLLQSSKLVWIVFNLESFHSDVCSNSRHP